MFTIVSDIRYLKGNILAFHSDTPNTSGRDWAKDGFPAFQGLESATRHRILLDHVDAALLRDVVERHDVRNPAGMRWLMRRLLGNPGLAFSREQFYKAPKAYPGLISVFDHIGRADHSHVLETTILVELKRRGFEVTGGDFQTPVPWMPWRSTGRPAIGNRRSRHPGGLRARISS